MRQLLLGLAVAGQVAIWPAAASLAQEWSWSLIQVGIPRNVVLGGYARVERNGEEFAATLKQ